MAIDRSNFGQQLMALFTRDLSSTDVQGMAAGFEEASIDGDINRMDQIADVLSRRVRSGPGLADRRRARLDRSLNRLGHLAQRSGGPRLSRGEQDLVQRLRTAVLANQDDFDALRGALGDVGPEKLASLGKDLAGKLRRQGRFHFANAIEAAVRDIGRRQGFELFGGNLDRMAEDFETASAFGNSDRMDSIVDRLAQQMNFDGSWRDTKLGMVEKGLDRLGEVMRRFESMFEGFGSDSAAARFDGFNDTIQRLRSAVLASVDGGDGLRSTLGDMPLDMLLSDAKDLSQALKRGPFNRMSAVVDQAIQTLEGMARRENLYGPQQNDQWLHRPRPMPRLGDQLSSGRPSVDDIFMSLASYDSDRSRGY